MTTITVPAEYLRMLLRMASEVSQLVKPIKLQIALLAQAINPGSTRFSNYLNSEEARLLKLYKEEIKPHLEEFLLSTFDDINRIQRDAKEIEQQMMTTLEADVNFGREAFIRQEPHYEAPNIAYKTQVQRLQAIIRLLKKESALPGEVQRKFSEYPLVSQLDMQQTLSVTPFESVPRVSYFRGRPQESLQQQQLRSSKAEADNVLLREKNLSLMNEIAAAKAKLNSYEKYFYRELLRELKSSLY